MYYVLSNMGDANRRTEITAFYDSYILPFVQKKTESATNILSNWGMCKQFQ
jgi:hypothetical protein